MPWVPAAIAGGIAIAKGVGSLGSGGSGDGPTRNDMDAAGMAADTKDKDYSFNGDNGVTNNPNYDPLKPEDASNPQFLHGATGDQKDAARYQGMGAGYASMQAPSTDYSMANQSRGAQADALSQMQSAAQGNQPSAAAIMMKQGNDQAVANQMAMAAGARGPAAMANAQQAAMGNASNMSAQNQNNIGALRAQEMAQARGAYMSGATGMRGMDQGQAQYLSDLAMKQRGLNLSGQTAFENMALQEKDAALRARMAKQGVDESHWATQSGMDEASVNAAYQHGIDAANTAASIAGAATKSDNNNNNSDVRVKDGVQLEGVDPLSKMRGR